MPDEIKELLIENSKQIVAKIEEVKKSHQDLDGRVGEIHNQLKSQDTALVEAKTEFQKAADLVAKHEKDLDAIVQKMAGGMGGGEPEQKSLGQMAAESEVLKGYRGAEVGKIHLGTLEGKAATTGAGKLHADQRPGVVTGPEQPLTVRNLLMVLPISTNAVEWVQELLFTNSAGAQNGEGAALGESAYQITKKTSAVETLGHWVPASRQVLSDLPLLQGIIDHRMSYGLDLEEEKQLLFGDGTNGKLHGIMPQATAFDTSLSEAEDNHIDQLRRTLLQATKALYPATGFVLSAEDWCDIQLMKDDEKRYLFGTPTNPAEARLWGKRVVESLSMTAGTYLAGAFSMAATLYDRQQTDVSVSDSHADFFTKNLVAIRVDKRLALTVERPAAFVKGTFA